MRTIKLQKEIQDDAIRFGNEANLARAIPYVRDGLKPSQRYTIYTAFNHGYTSNKPHVKSLKLDGQIVGEAWPHGSEYPTIVRLTQDFVLNIPLLSMHGANGSQLGTPDAAASRYTEVRLSEACEDGLLSTIKKDTCDWVLNYSEDIKLPALLPALLPELYVNGSDGMGFCYSQTWLPGNLIEFTTQLKNYIKIGKIDFNNLAPDFPTKGIIVNKSSLPEIYKTGKGTVILRGRANIVSKDIIKITELPYQIYVSDYLQQLKTLITSGKLTGISNIYNMSGDGGMDIEIECSIDPKIVLNQLYKYSNLQVSLSVNQYGIVDSIPELLNLQKYFDIYIDHNLTCLRKEYQFDLDKANSRLEVVNGLLKALSDIDSIINLIKASKSSAVALEALQTTFGFTKTQASAIIDMKLGKLANLERNALVKEADDLNKIVDKCTKFLASDKLQTKEFLSRLDKFTEKYGWQRRTEVCDIDLNEEKKAIKAEKVQERFNIILTKDNELKKVSAGKLKFDDNISKVIEVGEKDRFVLISNTGTMYKLNAKDIKLVSQGSKGQNIKEFFNDEIINIYTGNETEEFLIFVTKNGLIKKIESKIVFGLSKLAGAPVMKVEENDKIIYCELKTNSDIISIKSGKKEKQINISTLLSKGRLAGGIATIKGKLKEPIKIN